MSHFKYIFFLISLFILAASAHAQDVLYSQYDKFDSYSGDYAVVGVVGGITYTYRYNEEDAMLDAFDDSMNKTATIMLDFMPKKIYQIRFITYPDKMIVLYQALEGNKVIQYAALLDAKARLKKRPIELGFIKTGILGATRNYFFSAVSDDKKQIVTYTANEKGNEITFDGKWLDDSAKLTNHSHAIFKTDNEVFHGEVNIGNDGMVYVTAYTPLGALNYADHFWILCVAPGENKFDSKEMNLDNKFAANGYIKIDNANKQLYFGGFYSNKKSGNFDGLVFASFNTGTKAFYNIKYLPVDEDLMRAAGARNTTHAFDNFEVKQLIVKNDGGFVMVSEEHFVTTHANYAPAIGYYSFYSSGSNQVTREYHYNDILVMSYDNEGKRQWATSVPKQQFSQEDGGMFSSYALLNSGGSLAFLYNDFNRNHSRIQLSTVDATGMTDFHSFAPDGNDNPDWMPKAGKQVSARTLLIPCLRKKQICFAKVVF